MLKDSKKQTNSHHCLPSFMLCGIFFFFSCFYYRSITVCFLSICIGGKWAASIWPIFIQARFLLAQLGSKSATGQNGCDIKILKIIINNNFTNFIFCKIKFF